MFFCFVNYSSFHMEPVLHHASVAVDKVLVLRTKNGNLQMQQPLCVQLSRSPVCLCWSGITVYSLVLQKETAQYLRPDEGD